MQFQKGSRMFSCCCVVKPKISCINNYNVDLKCYDVSCDPHLIVDGDSIWPADAHIDQNQPLGAIQP